MDMETINLNRPITYHYSSLRFFKPGEHHISRECTENVLLLVYEGVLRFHEDGVPYEIHAGQYHIQRQGSVHVGKYASDTPKYLYAHFFGEWTNDEAGLPRSGTFDYAKFKPVMEDLHTLRQGKSPHYLQAQKFYELITLLYPTKKIRSMADKIADFIASVAPAEITIEQLCQEFHFSKNHIINLFKKDYGMTPIAYLNELRLNRAESLMEVTSHSLSQIALQCGFQTYSHFYKLFLRRHGKTPEQWRKKRQIGGHPLNP